MLLNRRVRLPRVPLSRVPGSGIAEVQRLGRASFTCVWGVGVGVGRKGVGERGCASGGVAVFVGVFEAQECKLEVNT